ncbi:MAG: FAD-binding oxidoreductase [Desulfobulbaceae bacterium]|nr:MAG: FAD-binding oxidoreductase [Desulfobulbaceae bacterium]
MKGLEQNLRKDISGEVYFDLISRGRYATDASHYQVMPDGVVVPKSHQDVLAVIEHAKKAGIPVLARGSGSSQCGQTVNRGLVIDHTKYLNRILEFDATGRRCLVEPGIVLDELNHFLRPHGLWFPVDVSTSSRATLGGMAGNNSAGSRSIRYGIMRDNVTSINAILADGSERIFGPLDGTTQDELTSRLLAVGNREREEIENRFPKVLRRVGGYNLDALIAGGQPINLAHLLIGSEGTLAWFKSIELKLSPLPQNRILGVCHFPTFYAAMDSAQHLVELDPTAIELIDRTMIELSRDIDMFRPVVEKFVKGEPAALLLVEFAEDDEQENLARLARLKELMADLGFGWQDSGDHWGGVVEAIDPSFQKEIFGVRKQGLNIMMSMKDERKPISFVEDCAVELTDLAEYTARLTDIFSKHNTTGTWYAHASVGCLHVRPVLNLRLDQDVKAMRAIVEEALEMVKEYKGSHSGEHGDGLVRSEFHEAMFGTRLANSFLEIKRCFDPSDLLNPGKIVNPARMDDRTLFRYGPDYRVEEMETVFDWSQWPGVGRGFQGAVEMCNNNGACRKTLEGSMCPSYRVTRDERDSTRGRANSLRLAISGQLGPGALGSEEMADTLKLCVSCKACRRECPTGVDMAKMKIEAVADRKKRTGFSLHDRLIGSMPYYAPLLSKVPWFANLRSTVPTLARIAERIDGFTSNRPLPRWRSDIYVAEPAAGPDSGKEVILFGDTFNTYFESENLYDAREVLIRCGYRVLTPEPADGTRRPVCCGRTYLTVGKIAEAKYEAGRLLDTFFPYTSRDVPIIGLEPSCLLCLRDEIPALLPGPKAESVAHQAMLFEEFWVAAQPSIGLKPIASKALVHGHCHQKAFGAVTPIQVVLSQIPELEVEMIESSCCGMAGVFGYGSETYGVSMEMAELSLLPAVRQAERETEIVADGASCRHQIEHGTNRNAQHVARLVRRALADKS